MCALMSAGSQLVMCSSTSPLSKLTSSRNLVIGPPSPLLWILLSLRRNERWRLDMDHPQHGTDVSLAAAFGHPGVARAYRHRPPYPDEVFDLLEGLITDRPRTVLDIGAGEGALARPLARRA